VSDRLTDRRPRVEDLVADAASTKRDLLLRVYRHRLPKPDLEDCLQQATLELVIQARRGNIRADRRFIEHALENKFKSRIIDVHRAIGGRSPAAAANARSVSIDRFAEQLPGSQDTAQQVIVSDELRRITGVLSQLTPDQRLVIASQTFGRATPAEFCERHGWGLEKYRKVAQRGRARLEKLLEAPDRQHEPNTRPLRDATRAPGQPAITSLEPTGANDDHVLAATAAPHGLRTAAATTEARPAPDQLAEYRRVLGDERSERLSVFADSLAPRFATRDHSQLLAERDTAEVAWAHLDRAGAYETRNIQRDRDVAETSARAALAAADSLEQRAASLPGRGHREERDTLAQAAGVQRSIADTDQRGATRYEAAERGLRAEGRHLDDWMTSHAAQAAMWLAAERELATRRERDIAASVDRAVAAPSREMLDRLGDPPTQAALRTEWEALARRVEHDRLGREAAIADRSTPSTDSHADRDIERRVERLNRDRGLERAGRLEERDIGIEL
jgi:DNA-directed RNA polymerase specialized sigma24 family protein